MSSSLQSTPTPPTAESTPVPTRGSDQRPSHPLGPRLLAEFIGTFFLVFTVLTAIDPKTGAGALAPLAIGSILMVMVFANGPISGGHLNPAVSLAVLIRGKLTIADWIRYTLTQLTAGSIGGLVAVAVLGRGQPAPRTNAWKILVVELLFTFALAYVVLHVATAHISEGNSYFGLAIGFTVTAGAFAVGGISGGAFNPAVALGLSILGRSGWNEVWIYAGASLAGALLAALTFRYMHMTD